MVIIYYPIYFTKQLLSRLDDERMGTPLNYMANLETGRVANDKQAKVI